MGGNGDAKQKTFQVVGRRGSRKQLETGGQIRGVEMQNGVQFNFNGNDTVMILIQYEFTYVYIYLYAHNYEVYYWGALHHVKYQCLCKL